MVPPFRNKNNFAGLAKLRLINVVSLESWDHQIRIVLGEEVLKGLIDDELLLALQRLRILVSGQMVEYLEVVPRVDL